MDCFLNFFSSNLSQTRKDSFIQQAEECFDVQSQDFKEMVKIFTEKNQEKPWEKHHFVPRSYFLKKGFNINNSFVNYRNLSLKNHYKIHYYAYKCSKPFIRKELGSALFLMSNLFKEFQKELDENSEVYKQARLEAVKIKRGKRREIIDGKKVFTDKPALHTTEEGREHLRKIRLKATQKYRKTEKGKQTAEKYRNSEKGKLTARTHYKDENKKQTDKKYYLSKKGKKTSQKRRDFLKNIRVSYKNKTLNFNQLVWVFQKENKEHPYSQALKYIKEFSNGTV